MVETPVVDRDTVFRDVAGLSVMFARAGEYKSRKTGEMEEGAGGVRITRGRVMLRMTALQLAAMFQLVKTDAEVRKILDEQLQADREDLAKVTF